MSTRTMNRAATAIVALWLAAPAQAAGLVTPKDGWASWQVEAVEGAPAQCCWDGWKERNPVHSTCKLDEERHNFGTRNEAKTDSVRVYARFAAGKVDRLRAVSSSCPIEARTPIADLGVVAADDSARWLIALDRQGSVRSEEHDVLAALAMHRGPLALDALSTMARSDTRRETRRHAVFWLGLLRGAEGFGVVESLMFGDPDAELRKHASFAVSQSKSPRTAASLIKLGNSDRDGGVRAQAWFWLAHTGAPEAEAAILAALRKDADEDAGEQGVFALSQLPGERAPRALIKVAEDQTLTRAQRKRAVFWLGQSESQEAQSYLEKVLTGKLVR
jgi:HEAT repeat protein